MDFWSYLYLGKSKTAVTQDAEPNGGTPTLPVGFSKEKHNKIFHPNGRHEGDTCKYDTMAEQEADAKGDELGMNDATAPVQKEEPKPSNKREKIKNLILKKRKDLGEGAEQEAERMIDEILKMKSSKERKAALHWVCKGAIRMPEDAPKVTEAIQYGERAKGKGNTDPMSYDSPMAMVNALHEFKPKEKAIDPDTVPELSDKKELPMGVTTYLVQDDRKGQEAMRRILNTHWGEDANPWCLLHGDGHGNLSDGSDGGYDSWKYWNHYNALPKRVAFKDGKLIAFMATDGEVEEQFDLYELDSSLFPEYEDEFANSGEDVFGEWMNDHHHQELIDFYGIGGMQAKEKWWDRNDNDHSGIPVEITIPNDKLGRMQKCEILGADIKSEGEPYKKIKDDSGSKTYIAKWMKDGSIQIVSENGVGELVISKSGSVKEYIAHGAYGLGFDNNKPNKLFYSNYVALPIVESENGKYTLGDGANGLINYANTFYTNRREITNVNDGNKMLKMFLQNYLMLYNAYNKMMKEAN